ncbi:MAG TPA: hypothetical protein VGF59_29515 [Bryobacteraceae bacterium]
MTKSLVKPLAVNLSVEEENLAAIPFAVLERRVGKRIGKLEIKGNKVLADGTEVRVVWQVQGNSELGLPTEQDLDIFVALGVLTFQSNFAKTITFTGRELAKILNISSVHGRFYRRLKMAMDRFIPLRFRALTATDRQEEVKWCNVFQEASFLLDRTTGRCKGTITWTDKLIQSMDSGFFRVLDARRYMELDGITAKHLYRYLAVAFEKTDFILIDARTLATEKLGILKLPKYLSRLMQTLEPAFDQLIRAQVLGSYTVVSTEDWKIALRRHPSYVPERKTLLLQMPAASPDARRAECQKLLEDSGLPATDVAGYCSSASTVLEFHALERAAQLLEALKREDVIPHVAANLVRVALEQGAAEGEGREMLDSLEVALEICRQKKRAGQVLRNAGGLLVKIARDPEMRSKTIAPALEAGIRQRFRKRESAVQQQQQDAEQKQMVIEYEHFCHQRAVEALEELPEGRREELRLSKAEALLQTERCQRLSPAAREREIESLMLQDLAKEVSPPFERWRLRKTAQQALLPFGAASEGHVADDLIA